MSTTPYSSSLPLGAAAHPEALDAALLLSDNSSADNPKGPMNRSREHAADHSAPNALAALEPYPLDYAPPQGFKLSIVMPVYNEEKTLREIVRRVKATPLPKEIILVDDCSKDGTRAILAELAEDPEIHVIYKPQNEGKGAALRTGFLHASGTAVIVQDADLEYDPRDIAAVVRPLALGECDVVYGSRFLQNTSRDSSLVHRFGNWFLTFASNVTTGLKITDMETCYKAFRREVLQGFTIQQNRFGFEPEVTAKIARRKHCIQEVPISYQARSYAEGKKIGIKDLFNALWCIVRYGWRD
jgi:glycosyltransferase involved in cell wall biosynthesis